jgi:hypothetical protein
MSTDPLFPKSAITLEAFYIVQYWDNWGFENGKYKEADHREYQIHSGPYPGYLGAVLAIIDLSKQHPMSKYDILSAPITGNVTGFDVNSGEI